MGMASQYNFKPKYIETIALPPSSSDVYFDGRATVGPTWDFENSEIHKWLEENCKDKFSYTWGKELEDNRMIVHVYFIIQEHVKVFKEKFEMLDWNIECDDATHWFDIELFYNLEDYNDDNVYEKEIEAIQWCRENTQHMWKYVAGQVGTSFYFAWENDAAGFKLRFL